MRLRKGISVVLCLLLACITGVAEAAVTLKGYQDNNNAYQYVFFGRYPQNQAANTPLQPILWRVLSADQTGTSRKALVWSDLKLDNKRFADSDYGWGPGIVLWDWLNTSSGTEFGNSTFLKNAFTAAESEDIAVKTGQVTKPYGGGEDIVTNDAVFILSNEEVQNAAYGFLTDETRKAESTTYSSNNSYGKYWTRSPGNMAGIASVVGSGGAVNTNGNSVDDGVVGVRPAFFLNLESLIFKSGSVFGTGSSAQPAAGAAGNPYLLYLSTVDSKDWLPTATVNGNQLTLAFSAPLAATGYPNVFHAYMDYASAPMANNLATAFELSDGATVTDVSFNGPSIVLTLSGAYAYGAAAPTVNYKGDAATDGIGFMDTGLVPTRLAAFDNPVQATNVTPNPNPNPNPGPGPSPDPTPVTPPTPTETATEFNNANQGRGVEVTFPTVTFGDPTGVATQLGGLTPSILTPGGITGTTIAPAQENVPGFTGLGQGWGAKIDIQLKSSTATGQIDLLPVGLTFLLSSADLSAANWTDADVVGNTAALLAKAMFAKQQAEGTNAGTLQDLTALLTDIVTITRDPSSPGGVRIDFPFLLANGAGAPKVITDNGKKYLVIFDGDRNGWLRDPVWLFRKAIVPTGIALTPTSLSLKKGESGNVTVVYTPTDATERDILWTGQGTDASVTVATVSKSSAADTWVVKGLTEGTVLLTLTASADRAKKATLAVTVSPAASELIESMSVSPVPPYHVGTEVDVWVVLKRAPSSVTVSIKRPDGNTDTPTVTIDGTSAYATYTLPELGAYTVTVQATDATGTYTKAASLTVTEREVNGDSSSGGCNAGLVPQGLAPGPIMGLLVLALAFARRRWR